MKKVPQLQPVAERMAIEGFDYCFRAYSDFHEVENVQFHKLRKAYCKAADDLENYILDRTDEECY